MKRIFLLLVPLLCSMGLKAQENTTSVVFTDNGKDFALPAQNYQPVPAKDSHFSLTKLHAGVGKKTTSAQDRWYSHFSVIDEYKLNPFTSTSTHQTYLIPLWFDSTVTQRYYDGSRYYYGAINFCSVGQVIDPIHFKEFNDTVLLSSLYGGAIGTSNLIQVTNSNAYTVDSIGIQAAYIRKAGRESIVDTLILSVAPTNHAYVYGQTAWPMIHDIAMDPSDTALVGFAPLNVDTSLRAALSDAPGHTGVIWKMPLTLADSDSTFVSGGTSYVTTKFRSYAVPGGGIVIPAGYDFAITATFKSGEATWNKGVDSFSNFNHWMPISGYENATGGYMTYWYEQFNDQNSSDLLFPKKTDYYEPTIYIQAHNNNPNFGYQYHNIEAHISCNSCPDIASAPDDTSFHHQGSSLYVKNINGNINSATVYPNPAGNLVAVAFSLAKASNVSVRITDVTGQIIYTQRIGMVSNGKAIFNTASLSGGMYFYTVQADNDLYTGRFIVSH